MSADETFLARSIELSRIHMEAKDGGPFGAVIVKDSQIISEGWNQVTSSNDPTAHAEMVAIRLAARELNSFQLIECTLYSSCEPCPMFLAAASWARVNRIVFAASRMDAARAGFDDAFLYEELEKPHDQRAIPTLQIALKNAVRVLEDWSELPGKTRY